MYTRIYVASFGLKRLWSLKELCLSCWWQCNICFSCTGPTRSDRLNFNECMWKCSPPMLLCYFLSFKHSSLCWQASVTSFQCKSCLQHERSLSTSSHPLDVHIHCPHVPFADILEVKMRSSSCPLAGSQLPIQKDLWNPPIQVHVWASTFGEGWVTGHGWELRHRWPNWTNWCPEWLRQ